jgi:hypothetical protein
MQPAYSKYIEKQMQEVLGLINQKNGLSQH